MDKDENHVRNRSEKEQGIGPDDMVQHGRPATNKSPTPSSTSPTSQSDANLAVCSSPRPTDRLENDDIWGDSNPDALDAIAGYMTSKSGDDLEPIPYRTLIRGAPIHVSDFVAAKPTPPSVIESNKPSRKRKLISKDEIVGPNSRQMDVVKKMMKYLENLEQQQVQEFNGQETSSLVSTFRKTVTLCTKMHDLMIENYKHLPGAIFDETVEVIGGPTFLELFRAAKKEVPSKEILEESRPYTLLELAVGYGLHCGQRKIQYYDGGDVPKQVKRWAHELENMSEQERKKFWDTKICRWKEQ